MASVLNRCQPVYSSNNYHNWASPLSISAMLFQCVDVF